MIQLGVWVGDLGLDYVRGSLQNGLSVARAVRNRVTGMRAEAIVSRDVPRDLLLDFSHGWKSSMALDRLVDLLMNNFADMSLIVELPLARPDDPWLGLSGLSIRKCDDEVYALAHPGGPSRDVVGAIRAADPSSMYNAFVVGRSMEELDSLFQGRLFDQIAADIVLIAVGAYDGEGFVVAHDPRSGVVQ